MESGFVKALLGLVCAVMPAALVYADATLTQDNREIEVFAQAAEGFNQLISGPTATGPGFGGGFATGLDTGLLSTQPSGAARAQAIASQSSGFDFVVFPVFTQIAALGRASAVGNVDAFSLDSDSEADATSDFDIQFTILTTQMYTIDANINDPGSGVTAYVRLREVGAGDFIYNLQQSGETGEAMGMLPPGDYELQARAFAAGFASSDGAPSYNRDGSFQFDFVIVPEPAAGLVMLCCAGVAPRRRRR